MQVSVKLCNAEWYKRRPGDAARDHMDGGIVLERLLTYARYDPYGVFGVLYSTSFWNGFQTVS